MSKPITYAIALTLAAACFGPGCTTSDDGATGTGGTSATAGNSSVGATSSTGGTIAGGGAAATSGGTTATTDAGACTPPRTQKCVGTPPAAAMISDFTLPANAKPTDNPPVMGTWGGATFGGFYAYPIAENNDPCDPSLHDHPITLNQTGGNLHVTGPVGAYSGMGIWWNCSISGTSYANVCTIDASAYTGIQFTVAGTAGPVGDVPSQFSFVVRDAASTQSVTDQSTCGTCASSCGGTPVVVPVTATATVQKFTWAQLGVTDPSTLHGIEWSFTDPFTYDGTGATLPNGPYNLDFTIDDLQFTTN